MSAIRVIVLGAPLLLNACGGGPAGRARPGPQPTPATPAGAPKPDRPVAAADATTAANGRVLPGAFSRHHLFLRAVVGGTPALLLFDSGASATILSPRLVQRLGLTYRGRYTAFGIGEPITGASVYDGVEIRLGPVAIRPETVLSWPGPAFPTYAGVVPDGVVGYDLLRAFVLLVDLAGQRVVAFDTSAALPAARHGAQLVALRVTHGLPVVDVDVFAGGQGSPALPPPAPSASTLAVVVDFGAGAALQLSRDASERLGFPARLRDARPRQLVGIGGAVELPEGFTDSVRVAGAAIPRALVTVDTAETPSVALADAEGFIGTEVLRRFAVTLDYARGRAVFEPNGLVRAPFCRNAAGLCVRADAALGGAEVVFVDPNSPAAHAGIRPGFLILAVDGTAVGQLSVAEVDRLLERGSGSLLEVVRNATQFRALARPETATLRTPLSRRAPPVRERTGELIRLPNH